MEVQKPVQLTSSPSPYLARAGGADLRHPEGPPVLVLGLLPEGDQLAHHGRAGLLSFHPHPVNHLDTKRSYNRHLERSRA